jgi:hypothetical protein
MSTAQMKAVAKSVLPTQLASNGNLRASVSLILASGGDERIWPDPISGRNRYGTKTLPAPDEIGFSSTTASNISEMGFAAASRALERLFGFDGRSVVTPDQWCDEIRSRIGECFGAGEQQVVLAASGTDAELLTLGLVAGLASRPITNVFVAPDETGHGIPLAAAGRHFAGLTALAQSVPHGQPVDGFEAAHIEVRTIAIRDESGRPRESQSVDRDVAIVVEEELKRGRDVLLHVLDASKTGLTGPTRQLVRDLAAVAPERLRVVVDACQLRCPLSQIQRDLSDGFIVNITGSKFVAGPAFAGALLLPQGLADEIAARASLPAGLSDYTAALDWPSPMRDSLGIAFKSQANIGLGLRWIAALENLSRFAAINEQRHAEITRYFASQVRVCAARVEGLSFHPDDDEAVALPSIVCLTLLDKDGGFISSDQAEHVRTDLLDARLGPVCHIGQAVQVGPRAALRMSLSAGDIADLAARMNEGQSIEAAFKPVTTKLDALFAKWSRRTSGAQSV